MMTLAIVLITLLFVDALRLRFRVHSLRTITSAPSMKTDEVCFLTAPGVAISEEVRQQMVGDMNTNELDVLDGIPSRWQSLDALSLVQLVEPATYRTTRLEKGRTAGVVIAVRKSVLERAGYPTQDQSLPKHEMVRIAQRLKMYACTTSDLAIVPGLKQTGLQLNQRKAMLQTAIGGMTWVILVGQPMIFAGLIGFAVLSPLWGGLTLSAFHLQPLMVLAFSPIRAWDIAIQALGRVLFEAVVWLGTLFGTTPRKDPVDPVETRRPRYTDWVKEGLNPFFEPRIENCPLCGDARLKPLIQTTDLVQRKPGTFTLEECGACRHVFQNPRLSLAGLDYYYSDFYDGLGEEGLESIFGYSAEPYWARARMVQPHIEPSRWLDVGAGHGHFCCTARDVFPVAQFEALDLSESVEEAARRGWADRGIRGLFPEAASDLKEQYDVVSMSHYLEHTREPNEEIQAANTALRPGGVLFIEVPDPQCIFGRLMGRWWLPWFQPQHQHLLSMQNIEKLLVEHGFEPLDWHTGDAHQSVDFLFFFYLLINRLAPPSPTPWNRPQGFVRNVLHRTVWMLGIPWIATGWLLDRVMTPFMRRAKHSNTYRVVARKTQ